MPSKITSDAVEVDISEYLERAKAITESLGAFRIGDCLQKEDIAAMERTLTIAVFGRTVLSIGETAEPADPSEVKNYDELIALLAGYLSSMRNADA